MYGVKSTGHRNNFQDMVVNRFPQHFGNAVINHGALAPPAHHQPHIQLPRLSKYVPGKDTFVKRMYG